MSSQEKYIYLIYQQIQGVLTPPEAKALTEWLNDSPENVKLQEEIIQSMALMDDFKPNFSIDEVGDYAEIRKKLGLSGSISKQQEAKKVSMISRRTWLGIAATLALLVTAALVFLNPAEPTLEWTSVASNDQNVKQVKLPDGSIAFLNKDSKIKYPKVFLGNNRPVQIQGEVFFEVKRDENKPFQISTRNSQVTVLGTAFNVRDYPSEKTTTVTVQSGKVAFSTSKDAQQIILTANESAIMNLEEEIITKKESANLNDFSYQSGELVFQNTSLTDVFTDLEKHFNVKIVCKNQALKNCNYSTTKQRIELDNILETLKTLYQIKVTKAEKGTYIITGGGC